MNFLKQFFTWWNGQTLGTRFHTWRHGERVGEDEFGNIYYRDKRSDRRWVIYSGLAEPSMVPPKWHGWLHHTVDALPDEQEFQPREWHKPHRPNMTGTLAAYRPEGSLLTATERPSATGDYEPWRP